MIEEKTFRLIEENICEGIIVIDKDGRITDINKSGEDLLGINKNDCIGKGIKSVIPQSKLLGTLKEGKIELNMKFFLNGREFIISRMPIISSEGQNGAIALFQDINIYRMLKNRINSDRMNFDILNTIINTINECVVVINKEGIITMMSKAYKEFLNRFNPEGKHVTEVIENTRLHKVLKSGIMEVGDIQEVDGNKMISMRVPIKEEDKIVGVIGKIMFKNVGDLRSLNKKLNNLEREVEFYKSEMNKENVAKYSFDDIIGKSDYVKQSKALGRRAGNTNSNVLIVGESGTGKELYAHAIHNSGKRVLGPFVKVNCAAIPSELLESELFGYEEGAFTGARKGGKKGKFQMANGGTIFLDEIGDMPMNMQVKILRAIQEKEIEKVGGNILIDVDVRIIAATNINLEKAVAEGKFRKDLYYRLNVIKIVLPTLRQRKQDIPELANMLRIKVSNRLGIYVEGISNETIECLTNYDWPGNTRELENIIERAIDLLDSDLIIQPKHLPRRLCKSKMKSYVKENRYLKDIVSDVEKRVILEYLDKTRWNKNKTAKLLGMSRASLYKKIENYKLSNNQDIY